MPTNDRKVNLFERTRLGLTGLKTGFLDFIVGEIDNIVAAIFQGAAGTLDGDKIGLESDTNDTFTLDLTDANRVITGEGKIIDLSQITGTGITEDVPFENANGVTYYVGIKFAEIPDGVELGRTGDPEYPKLKQTYGELAAPDSLTDTPGSNLRVFINGITESGVDHSGRTVRVWLVDPVSGVEDTAYFEGTSAYSNPDNYVDIPYTNPNGPLGQDTGGGPPSTTAAEYRVFIEGATWKKNTNLASDSDYGFIGTIAGNGPAAIPVSFNITSQVSVFINSLDRAYDGPSGAGSGRSIIVDSGAVELQGNAGSASTFIVKDVSGDAAFTIANDGTVVHDIDYGTALSQGEQFGMEGEGVAYLLKNPQGENVLRLDSFGRIVKPHVLEDDFLYQGVVKGSPPPLWDESVSGGATGSPGVQTGLYAGGVVEIVSGSTINNWTALVTYNNWHIRSSYFTGDTLPEHSNKRLRFLARYGWDSTETAASRREEVGFVSGSKYIRLESDSGDSGGDWYLRVSDGTYSDEVKFPGSPGVDTLQWVGIMIVDDATVIGCVQGEYVSLTLAGHGSSKPDPFNLSAWDGTGFYWAATVKTLTNAAKTSSLDYVWISDGAMLAMP